MSIYAVFAFKCMTGCVPDYLISKLVTRGQVSDGRREKKGWEAGSLRWREAGEKFKKASFRYLSLLASSQKKRTQQRFLTSI